MKIGDLVKINEERIASHSKIFDPSHMKTFGDLTGLLINTKLYRSPEHERKYTVLFRNGKICDFAACWLSLVEDEK